MIAIVTTIMGDTETTLDQDLETDITVLKGVTHETDMSPDPKKVDLVMLPA
jgi:hypothetical protein